MGIAALAVVACHFHSYLASGIVGRLLGEGFIGVDIFIFCSGFGLVTSWRKSDSILEFHKKRIKKILPTFMIITPLVLLFCTYLGTIDYGFKDWLLVLTSLGYWIGTDTFFEWYTPAILVLYLAFPLLCKFINVSNRAEEKRFNEVVRPVVLLLGGGDNQCVSIILSASVSLLVGCTYSNIYFGNIYRN